VAIAQSPDAVQAPQPAAANGPATATTLAATEPRIQAEVSSSTVATLKESLHPLAQAQYDAGRMSAHTELRGISIVFNRSAAQQADLEALIAAQQNPSSPLYHQWLTPEQFAARFGMAQSDLGKVQTWLEQQGFSVDSVARSKNLIRFSGTAGQVEQVFQTQMHFYTIGGEKHFAPSTELTIPSALAPVVLAVRNLDDFRPRPMHVASLSGRANPAFTSSVSGSVFFSPGDIKVAYGINTLASAGNTGAGQSIVVVGQSSVVNSDIEKFESAAGLPVKDPTQVLVPGSGSPQAFSGDQGESDLDLEWTGSIAPGANIFFVYTGSSTSYGVFDSIQYAVDEKLGNIISVSYGACEPELTAGSATALDTVFAQAATQGQTIVAASGDSGSSACYQAPPTTQNGLPPLTTQEQLAVSYPASSQYVTGVGGTEITSANDASGTQYWQSKGSSDEIVSLLKYIPEVAWNDDAAAISSGAGLSSTGGGASTLYTTQPSWQTSYFTATGETNPKNTARLVPDVSFYASPDLPGYLFCTSDTSDWNLTVSPIQTGSCGAGFRGGTSDSSLTVAGGTSFSTPVFAGMVAVLNQVKGYVTGQGLLNPELYSLAATPATYAAVFNDIPAGTGPGTNNECPSSAGANYCSSASSSSYVTTTGYDQVTGLGSLNLSALVTVWPTATTTLIGTSTSVSAASLTPNTSTNDTVTFTVASDSGTSTPTGNLTLSIDQTLSTAGTLTGGSTQTVALASNGTATYTANFATAGVHTIVAQYAGDSTHAASTGSISITVGGASSGKGTFALAATNITVSRGSSGTSTITVTPSGGYTGTVDLNFNTSNNSALGNLCYQFGNQLSSGGGSIAVTGTAAVTTQLTFDTNASDCGSSSSSDPPPGIYTITVTAQDSLTATITAQSTFTLTITGSGGSNPGPAPGAYFGTDSIGETFEALLLPNNKVYALYGTKSANVFTISGMITGTGSSANGSFSAPITDYYYTGSIYTGTVSATYVSGTSISGTVMDSGVGTTTFTASALPTSQYNFATSASLANLIGTWNGFLFGDIAASVTITSNGSFSGSSQGCSFAGTMTPDSSGMNFLDFSLTYSGNPCLHPNQTQTGIAVDYLLSDGVTRQLLAAVSSSSSGNVFVANGSASSASSAYSLAASSATAAPGSSSISTVTVSSSSGYSGAVTLSCSLTTSPSGATDLPTCTGNPTVTLSATATRGTATFTVNTTAANGALRLPGGAKQRNHGEEAGGFALALLILICVPRFRRNWISTLTILVAVSCIFGIASCGGGGGGNGSGGGGTPPKNPGTTAGTYTFTVTGVGSDSAKTTEATTFTLNVN